jgi:hypothetical protein
MEDFLVFSCSNGVDFFYPPIINSRQPFFCSAANCPPGRGIVLRRCVADSGFFLLGGRVLAHPGIAAEFAMADDANRSMAAPAIDGNRSSAESILCR